MESTAALKLKKERKKEIDKLQSGNHIAKAVKGSTSVSLASHTILKSSAEKKPEKSAPDKANGLRNWHNYSSSKDKY